MSLNPVDLLTLVSNLYLGVQIKLKCLQQSLPILQLLILIIDIPKPVLEFLVPKASRLKMDIAIDLHLL